MKSNLIIGGFVPFTTIDFPTVNSACVVFCQGCIWRCPYCQNKDLQPLKENEFTWENVFNEIKERKGFLDGVVFSGGEPIIQGTLLDAIKQVKSEGFKVAIHTSGAVPENLKKIIKYLDWVGFDVKAPYDKYDLITNYKNSGAAAKQSLDIVIESGVKFECRTTVDPNLLTRDDVFKIAKDINAQGVKNFAIQKCFDDERNLKFSDCFDEDFINNLKEIFPNLVVR